MEIEIGLTSILLFMLVFLATVQLAFGQLSDVGRRRLVTEYEERSGVPDANAFLNEILENRSLFRSILTTVIQIIIVAVAVLLTSLSLRWFPEAPFVFIAFVSSVVLTAIFRQLIPRLIAMRNPEKTFLALLPLFRPFYRFFALFAAPWHRSFSRMRQRNELHETKTDEEGENDADDIQALIDIGEEEGILEEEEGELIQSIIEFGDTRVNEVMTPRTNIVALPITATVREARDVIIESKYSRVPVYREQIDNVEGLIYVRDLLQYWSEQREDETIETLLRPAYLVPETKAVAELLEEMQKAHMQLALVIDEYGGLAGLVTIEDILEEIVGEIEDEDIEGEELVEIVEASDGYYEVLGSTEVGKIERLFDLEIEDDDFTTIAGLVINETGSVPRAGTQLTFRGIDVEVVEADERRIGRLRLRKAPQANGAPAG